MRWCNYVIVIFLCIFIPNCISELSVERKEKIINGFLEYLNNLPGQAYTYDEGVLTDAQKLDENAYRIQASLKATDIHNLDSHKLFQCSATISDLGESGVSVQNNEHLCQDADLGSDVKTPSKPDETSPKLDDGSANEIGSTEPTLDYQPIKLDNEIQTTAVTSGEQFIAIPREHPSVPCIGCSQHVNIQAVGVSDLAELAIKHLNKHDPNVRHSLNSVVEVERQVQVVNGVRYVLILIVDYNNCNSEETNACITKTPCKVSVLEKPWVKLPDGSKYRAILSNNCTAEWIYGDNGEVVADNDKNKESNDLVIHGNIQDTIDIDGARKPIPDYDKIANTGSADEILKAIHTIEVQAQQQPEKVLNEEQMKNLEAQIIPHGQTLESTSSTSVESPMTEASESIIQTVANVESVKHNSGKPGPLDDKKKSIDLSDDKKKALEDLINFFDSAHVEPKLNLERDLPRTRRSYDQDLKIMTLIDKYRRIKKNIDNAQYVYSLAQIMLDYINEMDMEIKTLVLRDVIAAEEEKENYQNFYYIQARATIPCFNSDCEQKQLISKICNGVIEVSEKETPQVLSAFCYDEQKEKYDIHSSKNVPADDPLLIKLSEQALNDIELSSSHSNAMKITKIVQANTQKVSGTLTKITMIIAYTDCKKTVPLKKRSKCKILENFGSNICEVEIHERHWLKEKKIRHMCTERPIDESFSDIKHIKTNEKMVADPKILEMVQEALQYLEIKSNRNNKQKVVKIQSVKTQILAGLLTYIDFLVGYTTCPNDFRVDLNSCELMQTEPLRKCNAQVWDRPWLEDGRQVNVSCNDDVSNEIPRVLKKRSADVLVGGQNERDPDDKEYKSLAEESLKKYLETSEDNKPHIVVKVEKVTVQVVAGKLTRIDFIIAPKVNDEESSKDKEKRCHSKIWEQSWLDFKEINVTCVNSKPQSRIARGVPGGHTEQDPSDAHYKALAEKSLKKFVQSSTGSQHFEVIRVKKVTTQVVSGSLTKIDFTISPTNCRLDNNKQPLQSNCLVQEDADEFTCHSEVWEQPWIPKEEITVSCDVTDSAAHYRQKRESFSKPTEEDSNNPSPKKIGGLETKDPNDPKYRALAEESLMKYLQTSGNNKPHNVVKVEKVTVQVVSGKLTRIDFIVAPEVNDEESSKDIEKRCHSKIWEQSWLDFKEINVTCVNSKPQSRIARGVPGGHTEQDPSDAHYKALAEKSLKKFVQSSTGSQHFEVIRVKKVTTQVVSGSLTKIDFTISPTNCRLDNNKQPLQSNCLVQEDADEFTCHSEVWEQPWIPKEEITVSCDIKKLTRVKRSLKDSQYYDIKNKAKRYQPLGNNHRHKRYSRLGGTDVVDSNKKEYKKLAEESLRKHELLQNSNIHHVVVEVKRVTEQVVSGKIINIDFTASPTSCPIDINQFSSCIPNENILIYCHSKILTQPWLGRKDIKISCRRKVMDGEEEYDKEIDADNVKMTYKSKHTGPNRNVGAEHRKKRQVIDDEDMDEDMKYYYADRAVQQINDRSDTNNLQKLVSIHAFQISTNMGTNMIRMYIETAFTYCLRHERDLELDKCDELGGMRHRLCLARLWPSPDDELVVRDVHVVCDDSSEFQGITGMSTDELIRISLKELERSPAIKHKLVSQGEPYIIPTLDSNIPITMNFIIAFTNCTKDVDTDKRFECFIDTTIPSKGCVSYMWTIPNSRNIQKVKAKCGPPQMKRKKRSVAFNSTDSDYAMINNMVQESLEKLEMASVHKYKQRPIEINSYSRKVSTAKVTTIDFDVGYTSCLKYEWIENITNCDFLEHLPRRHCVSHIYERLWVNNGRHIDINCEDDETPLEAHIEFENAENAMQLANEALKHIEAKYPNTRKQKVVRIFSLEKQVIAGIHYRMKIEVGSTNCIALSVEEDCEFEKDSSSNKFCRVNIWLRPWTDHPPIFRVSCDYQSGAASDLYRKIQAEHLFYNFIATYKPHYEDDHGEMLKRFKIFEENVRKIHELNIHERGTAKYAVTRFADLTYEEFSTKYLGLKPKMRDTNQIPLRKATIPEVSLPDKFDWREHNAVTEVKNQGSCGSCWAFSVTGNIEGQWKIKSGQLLSLSEQELVDCDKLDEGCNGGLPDNAYRAIEQMGGLETEADYPYEGEDDKCAFNRSMTRVQITGAVNITTNETDMAKWLVQHGPISIGINANAMQFYVGGVSHPWKMLCNPNNLDHGVLIVGYGTKEYPLFHKKLPYWIVKNSWGPSWGEQGYYRVYRGDGTCGLNQMASSAIV